MNRRVVSVWFQRLPSERVLRTRPVDGPFALSQRQSNTERVYCLNTAASAQGLQKGMGLGEARVLCPNLQTAAAAPEADARFMQVLARWATQYCPWVAIEPDGLVLDITGSAHLRGGEKPLLEDISTRLSRAGLSHRLGLADTYGAAWALARFGQTHARVERKGAGTGSRHYASAKDQGAPSPPHHFWQAATRRRVCTLHAPQHSASPAAFRRYAPEPGLAFGSASGASKIVLLGKVPPAPRGKSCACGGAIAIGPAPWVAGGAGRTSPQAQRVPRRHRRESARQPHATISQHRALGGHHV